MERPIKECHWRLQLTVRQVASRADRIAELPVDRHARTLFAVRIGMKLWTPTPVSSRSIPMTLAPGPFRPGCS